MADPLYDEGVRSGSVPFDFAAGPLLTAVEPVFDAASFVRFGRDIFWQPDLVSNELGAEWLQRHLGPGFRIHRIGFRERFPTHIGTTLVPIRPGIVLVNPGRPCTDDSLELFTANGWRVIDAPLSARSGAVSRDVSNWISMNVLMLDEHTAVVERTEKPMIALLESLGLRGDSVRVRPRVPVRRKLSLLHDGHPSRRRAAIVLPVARRVNCSLRLGLETVVSMC